MNELHRGPVLPSPYPLTPLRILDLFCGPGGAGVGYARAGFRVSGVDIKRQSAYPFEHEVDDALVYLEGLIFDRDIPGLWFGRMAVQSLSEAFQELQEAAALMMAQFEIEEEENGFPFNFGLRDAHRNLRRVLRKHAGHRESA